MPTTSVADPTGTAGWAAATITTNSVGVTTSAEFFLRGGGAIVIETPAPTTLQPLLPGGQPTVFTPAANTEAVIFFQANGGMIAQYYGLDSAALYPTNFFSQFTYLPGGTLASTFFINGDGRTAGATLATS